MWLIRSRMRGCSGSYCSKLSADVQGRIRSTDYRVGESGSMTNPWHARDALAIALVAGLTMANLTAFGQSPAKLSSAEAVTPARSLPSLARTEVKAEVEERNYTREG